MICFMKSNALYKYFLKRGVIKQIVCVDSALCINELSAQCSEYIDTAVIRIAGWALFSDKARLSHRTFSNSRMIVII